MLVLAAATAWLVAQPPAPKLTLNRTDEVRSETFDLERGVEFADRTARAWNTSYGCVTCHTNGLYLVARASLGQPSDALEETRAFVRGYLDRYVVDGESPKGRKGAIEGLVASAAFLTISESRVALSDAAEAGMLHAFEQQHEDGHWPGWLKCGWPPFEVDDHFGVTLMAVATGALPEAVANRGAVRRGTQRLRRYLRTHPPANPQQIGMMLWASKALPRLATAEERARWTRRLLELQREDGGWSTRDLGGGSWRRGDGSELDARSDAYATAFCVFALRQGDVAARTDAIQDGLAWLRHEQRASGRWFSRSPYRDRKHFISHAATNFALMAFAACRPDD